MVGAAGNNHHDDDDDDDLPLALLLRRRTSATGICHTDPTDAPENHIAHKKVLLVSKHRYPSAYFKSGDIRIQATQKQAGSLDEAARICRLVYFKHVQDPSLTHEQLIEYRDHLLLEAGGIVQGAPQEDTDADHRPTSRLRQENASAVTVVADQHAKQGGARIGNSVGQSVPSKSTFLQQAALWAVRGINELDLEARPCRFKTGTLGWMAQGRITLDFGGTPLQCTLNIQGHLFNSRGWPESATTDTSAIQTIDASGSAHGIASNRTAGRVTQSIPSQISDMLNSDDWREQWKLVGRDVAPTITVGPWGELGLSPKVFSNSLGWHGRKQKGRSAPRSRLLGNGGLGTGIQWAGKDFVAPCQVHATLVIIDSRRWLGMHDPEAENVALAVEAEHSSEDEAEQAELQAAAVEDDAELTLDSGEQSHRLEDREATFDAELALEADALSHDVQEERVVDESQQSHLRPAFRLLPMPEVAERADDKERACVRTTERHASSIRNWHMWFKSMNADTFFGEVGMHPDYLRRYTAKAAALDERDLPGAKVVPKMCRMVEQLRRSDEASQLRVIDLGSGEGLLERKLNSVMDVSGTKPFEVTSVDAIAFNESTHVFNLGSLPKSWTNTFNVAILSRSLWARDYVRILMEAKRVLVNSSQSRLLICEPFRRWWGRDKRRPLTNALPWMVQRCGFSIEWHSSEGTEPRSTLGKANSMQHSLWQYIVAAVEPENCVVCRELPVRCFPKGFRLCVNCELSEAGVRPQESEWPAWATAWAEELTADSEWPSWAVAWAENLADENSLKGTGSQQPQNRGAHRLRSRSRSRSRTHAYPWRLTQNRADMRRPPWRSRENRCANGS